jgi:hypothetical protein
MITPGAVAAKAANAIATAEQGRSARHAFA